MFFNGEGVFVISNLDKLTKLFSERTNPYHINITTGKVIGLEPLEVQYGDKIILRKTHLIISNTIAKSLLQLGDKVILVPDNDFKKWYVIDKVVEL